MKVDEGKAAEARALVLGDLTQFLPYVRTEDPHSPTGSPVRPLPLEKAFCAKYFEFLEKCKRLRVKKSRQILATWMTLAWGLFRAMSRPSWPVFLMSYNLDEGKKNIMERLRFMVENLPPWMGPFETTDLEIRIPWNRSYLRVFPCTDRVGRGQTIGDFIGDEPAEWPSIRGPVSGTLTRALGPESHLVMLSTARAGEWQDLLEGENIIVEGSRKTVPGVRGMEEWRTKDGYTCVWIPYFSDPAKDPATAEGAIWRIEALREYKGDPMNPDWQREMEGNPNSIEGDLLFPSLHRRADEFYIEAPTEIKAEDFRWWAAFDHGTTAPACLICVAVDRRTGVHHVVEELYRPAGDHLSFCASLRAMKTWPLVERNLACDLALTRRDQSTGHGLKSWKDLYDAEGIFFRPAPKPYDVDGVAVSQVRLMLERNLLKVWRTCPIFWSTLLEARKGAVKTKNREVLSLASPTRHAWDAFKYGLLANPPEEESEIFVPEDGTTMQRILHAMIASEEE